MDVCRATARSTEGYQMGYTGGENEVWNKGGCAAESVELRI